MLTELDMVSLRQITISNLDAVLGLELRDDQKRFLASNEKSLAQALFY